MLGPDPLNLARRVDCKVALPGLPAFVNLVLFMLRFIFTFVISVNNGLECMSDSLTEDCSFSKFLFVQPLVRKQLIPSQINQAKRHGHSSQWPRPGQ